MVILENVTKTYGEKTAVEDISFEMERGRIYGLLGPNGAGKSTTMNIMTGYIGATSGSVTIDDFDIFYDAKKAKENIGYLPEVPPLYSEMTVAEYLRFVAELKGVPKKERKDEVETVIEKTGLQDEENTLIRKLSKGYKQRVGFAQALMKSPEVLILDEPTAGLDPLQIKEFNDLLSEIREEHIILISSHILSEISAVCDHVFMIAEGKLVYDGDITPDVDLENVFLTHVMHETTAEKKASRGKNKRGNAETAEEQSEQAQTEQESATAEEEEQEIQTESEQGEPMTEETQDEAEAENVEEVQEETPDEFDEPAEEAEDAPEEPKKAPAEQEEPEE